MAPGLYGQLHRELNRPSILRAWRPRGRYIPLSDWEQFLTDGLYFGCVARDRRDGSVVGLLELRDFDPVDGHAYLSMASSLEYVGSGRMIEAAAVFIDEAFSRSRLNKIYVLSTDLAPEAQGALVLWTDTEGVLRDHVYIDGAHRDVRIGAIRPDRFGDQVRGWPARALAPNWRLHGLEDGEPPSSRRPVTTLLEDLAAIHRIEISDATPLEELARDSLAALELLVILEDFLGHEVEPGYLDSVATIGELRCILGAGSSGTPREE